MNPANPQQSADGESAVTITAPVEVLLKIVDRIEAGTATWRDLLPLLDQQTMRYFAYHLAAVLPDRAFAA